MKTTRDYYKILGVTSRASQDEIKKSFRRLAHKCHPDKSQNAEEAREKFVVLKEAYDVLFDPRRRSLYDEYHEDISALAEEKLEKPFRLDFAQMFRSFGEDEILEMFQSIGISYYIETDLLVSENYMTPLQYASIFGYTKVTAYVLEQADAILDAKRFKLFIEHGKYWDSERTAMHLAIEKGEYDIFRLLFDAGVEVYGSTLSFAIKYNQFEIVHYLLQTSDYVVEEGKRLNDPLLDGYPLHLALRLGYAEIAEILIDYVFDVNAKDEYGHTAMYYAETFGYNDVVAELKEAGALY